MTPPPRPRIWATLPTYNEAGNIESLTRTLLEIRPDLGVVVIDDDSPDGTWRIVEGLVAEFPGRVDLVHRTTERGRGSAGVAGFKRALELGADYVIEMDADWSHHPRHIPDLLAAAMGTPDHPSVGQASPPVSSSTPSVDAASKQTPDQDSGIDHGIDSDSDSERTQDARKSVGSEQSGATDKPAPAADVVIGSRLIKGGGETGRSVVRTLITHAANTYIRLVLGLRARDCTSGYRVFSRRVLEGIDWDRVESNGPAIVQEILLACRAQGARIVEVPIRFEQRRAGQSTFNTKIMLAGLRAVLKFRFRKPPVKP